MTEKILKKLCTLKAQGDRERFDKIGWILAMAMEFNYLLKQPFLFCTKCTGARSLKELAEEKVVDFDKLKLYKAWFDSDKD